jgi:CBS-domain-containing membrane protein
MIGGNTVASLAFAVQIHMLESSYYASTANMSHANAYDCSNLGARSI